MEKLNKKGVFGLNAIQTFFATILGIALLAYVIVVIMGVLSGTTILSSITGTITNESVRPIEAGTLLSVGSYDGCSASITNVYNGSTSKVINSGNYSISGCTLTNLTSTYALTYWNVSYTYSYNSNSQSNMNSILGNTSTGITGFFSAINPVYAILAVLVIILVLVVLVRVVQSPNSSASSPQL